MLSRRIFITFLSFLLLFTNVAARPYQGQDGLFFEDTGQYVSGDFLTFYKTAPDPVRMFGNPISAVIPDDFRPGIQVQYFERVRMDFDPSKPAGKRVTLADLGRTLRNDGNPGQPLSFSTNTNMCRAFSNGRLVCYAFLQYYDRFNGEQFFGLPISDTEMLDGRLVQYFENARMEWLVDRPVGERVALTALGRAAYDIRVGTLAQDPSIPEGKPMEITAQAFASHPTLAAGQEQQVDIIVQDRKNAPVADVNVMVTAVYPNGRSENYRPSRVTDKDGLTHVTFTIQDVQPNQMVKIIVSAEIPNGPKTTTQTWFRTWW